MNFILIKSMEFFKLLRKEIIFFNKIQYLDIDYTHRFVTIQLEDVSKLIEEGYVQCSTCKTYHIKKKTILTKENDTDEIETCPMCFLSIKSNAKERLANKLTYDTEYEKLFDLNNLLVNFSKDDLIKSIKEEHGKEIQIDENLLERLMVLRKKYGSPGELTEDILRKCSDCGKLMVEGYIEEGDYSYYCSEECLDKNYSKEEKEEALSGENLYYTEWA